MRIVAADDYDPERAQLSRILNSSEHEVLGIVEDGQQALDLCEKFHPDVVILDVGMPVLNGLQAARKIRQHGLAKHIILATSLGNNEVRNVALEVGAKQVVKPYRAPILLRDIAALEAHHNGDALPGS